MRQQAKARIDGGGVWVDARTPLSSIKNTEKAIAPAKTVCAVHSAPMSAQESGMKSFTDEAAKPCGQALKLCNTVITVMESPHPASMPELRVFHGFQACGCQLAAGKPNLATEDVIQSLRR